MIMNQPGEDGIAGVVNGLVIPFVTVCIEF